MTSADFMIWEEWRVSAITMQSPEAYKTAEYGFCFKDDVPRVSRIKSSNIQEILSDDSIWWNGEILG